MFMIMYILLRLRLYLKSCWLYRIRHESIEIPSPFSFSPTFFFRCRFEGLSYSPSADERLWHGSLWNALNEEFVCGF